LFERFYKTDDIHVGTGIGLSLAKDIVELHKGFIIVESEPGNTRFEVSFPQGKPEDMEMPILKSTFSLREKLKPESLLIDETIDLEEVYSKTLDDFEKKKLLLVEDNNELLEYLFILLKEDYKITTASNGIEALKKIEENKPDVIVSDVLMPKMDGFALCEIVKSKPETMSIPFIWLTAKTKTEEKIKGLRLGADDYLDKPFNTEVLKTKIHMLIKNKSDFLKNLGTREVIDITKLARNPVDEKFLKQVLGHINENLENEEYSVEKLSDFMVMSRSNLFRRLKLTVKMSPVEFIYYVRLQKALELLLGRKLSISEIAWKVGFKNPSSFSKSFKKQFGKSPTDYLNDLLKK